MTRRRLLFLSPFAPTAEAAHGGGRVLGELLPRLAARHRLALVCLRGDDEPAADAAVREACERIEELPRPGPRRSRRLRDRLFGQTAALRSLLAGRPKWATYCYSPQVERRVRAMVEAWEPEVVQFEYHVMGGYAGVVEGRGAPRVLHQHEPGAAAAADQGLPGLRPALERRAWRRFERRVAARMDAVVVLTERDRQAMELLGARRVVRIPLATTLPARPLDPRGAEPPSLLFVGSFRHPPNVAAADRLARRILPRVRERVPGTLLDIVGEAPPERLRGVPGVRLAGRVPAVEPWLDRAAVVVAPLDIGGGMRVKVLEALAAGKAVVATRRAVEGLAVRDGEQVVIADDDDAMANAIVALLGTPERRAELAGRARAWAVAHLGWERAVTDWCALYDDLLGAAR